MTMTSLRRNMGKDIPLADTIIKKGDFLAYWNADVHMNPNIYTNPDKFDPLRYTEGREEDQKETFAYLAWGVGKSNSCPNLFPSKLTIIHQVVTLALVSGLRSWR